MASELKNITDACSTINTLLPLVKQATTQIASAKISTSKASSTSALSNALKSGTTTLLKNATGKSDLIATALKVGSSSGTLSKIFTQLTRLNAKLDSIDIPVSYTTKINSFTSIANAVLNGKLSTTSAKAKTALGTTGLKSLGTALTKLKTKLTTMAKTLK
ncbi:MAG: hypothetical protein J6I73_09100 [Treponema sp.]|nr:hypothetical protein [Treponema sp.]